MSLIFLCLRIRQAVIYNKLGLYVIYNSCQLKTHMAHLEADTQDYNTLRPYEAAGQFGLGSRLLV